MSSMRPLGLVEPHDGVLGCDFRFRWPTDSSSAESLRTESNCERQGEEVRPNYHRGLTEPKLMLGNASLSLPGITLRRIVEFQ